MIAGREAYSWYQGLIDRVMGMFSSTAGEAARTSIYLAASAAVQGITGAYFAKEQRKELSPKCGDIPLRKELCRLSETLTGLEPDSVDAGKF